ncbi:MAG: hypothetical protein KUG77_02720 [Nannocystaceae bacterium]|nr:hypothetical protein [Nannocystaceae bacterium]
MKPVMQATFAAVFLLAGCEQKQTSLGEFDDDQAGATAGPVGQLCQQGDEVFGASLSSALFGPEYAVEMECTVEELRVESEQPQGPASITHRILDVVLACEGDGASGEVVLSLSAPLTEGFPFEVGLSVLVDAQRGPAVGIPREQFTVFSASDGEVLLSSVQEWSHLAPEDAPPGLSCIEAWQDRLDELTDWLEPLGAAPRESSCIEDGLSLQLADREVGPGRAVDAPDGHRIFVDEATCDTGEDGEHALVLRMGYWRVP